jgi:hypothetical protein
MENALARTSPPEFDAAELHSLDFDREGFGPGDLMNDPKDD